ncbi:MAG: class I SAM-dependent methyltransferase [Tepidiformaceae bacterium]
MGAPYDPAQIRRFYDNVGEREWRRLDGDPRGRVVFFLHRWHLRQFVNAADSVLEAGAGAGRFTVELASLGARITVADISGEQLRLNEQHVSEAGRGSAVVERVELDIVDCSRFPDERFDAVVCYGSPLSYVRDQFDRAWAELVRVTRHGGHLLISVTSGLNTCLPWLVGAAAADGIPALDGFVATGDLDGAAAGGHPMRSYRWSRLRPLLERQPVDVVAVSASNFLATIDSIPALREIERDPTFWESFLRWELDFCKEPGAIDSGSHIIAVVRKR